MTELTKLEVGKTYVFKNKNARREYLSKAPRNGEILASNYREGFYVEMVSATRAGWCDNECIITSEEIHLFKLKEEPMKNIKPEDEIAITTTYGELAKVYAIMGGVGFDHRSWKSLWFIARDILDSEGSAFNNILGKMSYSDVLDYPKYKQEWLDALFPQETQQQKEVRELREQAKALLEKAEQLEKSLKQ